MKKVFVLIGILIAFVSCNTGKNKLILKSSTGRINSVLVVIDNTDWDTEIGTAIKDIVKEPVKALPQPEMQLRVSQINPANFSRLFQNNRNLLIIGISKQNSFKVTKNKYASPQTIINITGKNKTALIKLIKEKKTQILSIFKKSDLHLYQSKLHKNIWAENHFKLLKNSRINLPHKYLKVEDLSDFLWIRRYIPKDGAINILAYSIPLPKAENLDLKSVLSLRDSIGKTRVPGQFKDTYMQTSKALTPIFKSVIINGTKAFETRGLWEVKNDFMGGAFINYSFIDSKNNRLLCLDGFVYAPNQNKRDYIFELEAIFKTLKIE
ncbi:MAG: DUF4837 family protein [Flavobacteriaceae bacterium]|nr:DUF4837 family protein [Flavobacteriaceae bacterium]